MNLLIIVFIVIVLNLTAANTRNNHARSMARSRFVVRKDINQNHHAFVDNKPVNLLANNLDTENKTDIVRKLLIPIGSVSFISIAICFFAPKLFSSFGHLRRAPDTGFIQSFLLVLTSELGDKTFFITALTAAKHGKMISLLGSSAALACMTIISAVIGQLFHIIPPSLTKGIPWEKYIAIAAFSYFGVQTILDASKLTPGRATSTIEEEKEEAAELLASETNSTNNNLWLLLFQIFSLVFAAEVGDRSMLSTVALSTTLNPIAVSAGAISAQFLTSCLAVIGGEMMSKYLSERIIGYIGGSLFVLFAVMTAMALL